MGDMETFSLAYRTAQELAGQLAQSAQDACRERCSGSLGRIFDAFRHQAIEPAERWFVDELEAQCGRLLDEELGHYRRRGAAIKYACTDPEEQACALGLLAERHFFGLLQPSVVQEILDLGAGHLREFRNRADAGRLTRADLSVDSGPVVRSIAAILNREFKRLGALDAISAYARRQMRVFGLALELSVPQADWWRNGLHKLPRPPKTLYAHVDESIVFPKAIVYLSDVAASNGPTGCYPRAYEDLGLHPLQEIVGRVVGVVGADRASPLHAYYNKGYHQSVTSEGFRRHFMKLPPRLRFNSHFGWDIAPDSDAEQTLGEREQCMTGPAGTFMAFDGARLLHRGGLVQSGERVALQVVFSDHSFARSVVNKIRRLIP